MPTPVSLLKFLRQTHLYIGVFISPALLFFALTGALQTFSLHETTQGSSYKPPAWIVTLAQIHKKQTDVLPRKRPQGPPGSPEGVAQSDHPAKAPKPALDTNAAASAPTPPPAPAPKSRHPLPLKIFFLLVSLGLFTSTLTGITMAYRYNRNAYLITSLLLAGVLIPLLLLKL